MVRILAVASCFFFALCAGAEARAERRPFLYAHTSSVVPDGDAEVETWLDFVAHSKTSESNEWIWWIGARWSPLEDVELTALTVLTQPVTDPEVAPSVTQLWAEQMELRWRALHTELADVQLQLDARLALANDLPHQLAPSLALTKRAGVFDLSLQAGYAFGFGADKYGWIVWRAGAAAELVRAELVPGVRVGVEGFGEAVLSGKNDLTDGGSTANVGPTLSIAKGRGWITLGALIGLTDDSPRVLARAILGLAL